MNAPVDTAPRIRAATPEDEADIRAMVLGERLNPTELRPENFLVAEVQRRVVGAVQLRRHPDGSRELGSLVVRREHRGTGLAHALIERLLQTESGPVFLITARTRAGWFERWGFAPRPLWAAPGAIRRHYALGQLLGGLFSLLKGRKPRRLAVLGKLPEGPLREEGRLTAN